jgi:hypothetical protein
VIVAAPAVAGASTTIAATAPNVRQGPRLAASVDGHYSGRDVAAHRLRLGRPPLALIVSLLPEDPLVRWLIWLAVAVSIGAPLVVAVVLLITD